ncbi:hypothetical protein; putative signal peptide [Pseudomonas entomophila L48]|uniref:Uncharacterized protein n=1 Tax=Pseudomonas entomophila (strain L48) TaxID=384676 RepID=Q1IBB2_PSEE4|nr:hypothetical protein; putative signal peptide [Pseudomonas entomophila L48]
MKIKILFAAVLAAVSLEVAAEAIYEKYPGPWVTTANAQIESALERLGADGCYKYKYRASRDSESEFVVYCASRGSGWNSAYLLWPNIDRIMGPYPTDPSMP